VRALTDRASKLCSSYRERAAATAATTATAAESDAILDGGLDERPRSVSPCPLSREELESELGALHDIVTSAVTERRGTSVLMCRNGSAIRAIFDEALPSLAQLQYSGLKPVLVGIHSSQGLDAGALFFDILRKLHRVIGSTFDTSLAPAEVCTQLKALLTKTAHSGSGRSSGDGGAEPMILLKLHDIDKLRGSLYE
jgi:hypothetical protein